MHFPRLPRHPRPHDGSPQLVQDELQELQGQVLDVHRRARRVRLLAVGQCAIRRARGVARDSRDSRDSRGVRGEGLGRGPPTTGSHARSRLGARFAVPRIPGVLAGQRNERIDNLFVAEVEPRQRVHTDRTRSGGFTASNGKRASNARSRGPWTRDRRLCGFDTLPSNRNSFA